MYFEDFTVGDRYALSGVKITREQIKSFAREYDPFPMHTDESYAASARFGDIIAPGVMSFMAVWAELVKTGAWREHVVAGKSTRIEWFAPVFDGDMLYGTATVAAKEQRNAYNGIVTFSIDVVNQNGETVLHDDTEFIIAARSVNA